MRSHSPLRSHSHLRVPVAGGRESELASKEEGESHAACKRESEADSKGGDESEAEGCRFRV